MAWVQSLSAMLAMGVLVVACASPTVPTAPAPSAALGTPSASARTTPLAPSPSTTSIEAPAGQSAGAIPSASPVPLALLLGASPDPAFAGDRVLLAVGNPGPARAGQGVSSATVDFGDGTSTTATAACGGGLEVAHAYLHGGAFVARVTTATPCDSMVGADLSGAWADIHVYPAAPGSSSDWPTCTAYDLHMGGGFTGAGLGNVATQVTLRNVSRRGCVVEGYPDVVLVAADGSPLPTHATPATTGAYMFPAIEPHRVALEPGGTATFMLAYTDNPFGAGENEPYAVACPSSAAIRVILPGTHQFGTATFPMGVCGGVLRLSPIVPGAARIQFP